MQPNNNIALNKNSSGTIPSVYSLWLFRPQYLSCILQLAGVDLIGFDRVYSVLTGPITKWTDRCRRDRYL